MTVLAFDVNETLLDLRALDAPFTAAFGDAALRPQWVALTNSPADVADAQMRSSALRDFLESVYSADEVRALKPAPQPYRMVAERCGVPIGEVRLVAAHGWDIAGALAAGCRAAFVARP